jgi:uncharacterized BrkB/YihY/UPF0761 family membrane protein
MVLVLLAVFGLIYGNSEVARREILHQVYSYLDRSSARAVEDIAASAVKPTASAVATVVGIAVALFGASVVFGQLQDALKFSTRRETLLARCAARRGTNRRVVFGRQIRPWKNDDMPDDDATVYKNQLQQYQ